MVIGSRMLAGIFAANMAVASAYIADITPKEKRSARMGLVGMAIGFGFIFGPIIGAVSYDRLGITGPGWAAGILCSVNFVMAFIFLKESRTEEADTPSAVKPSIGWLQVLSRPVTGFMIILSFAVTVCFACFEVTFSRMMVTYQEYKISQISYLFAFCAFVSAMVQGGLIGRLVKRYGEGRLIVVSCFLYSASLFWLPIAGGMVALVLALGLLGLGSGMNRPPTFGLISMMTSEAQQGAVMGVAQGAGSLARIVGPLLAGVLYDLDHRAPYFFCGLIAFAAGVCASVYLKKKQSYIQERMPQSST
jgi:DHA1 family tetracycline resistance protein-like MFS transporter